jgi:hypothetical protein
VKEQKLYAPVERARAILHLQLWEVCLSRIQRAYWQLAIVTTIALLAMASGASGGGTTVLFVPCAECKGQPYPNEEPG